MVFKSQLSEEYSRINHESILKKSIDYTTGSETRYNFSLYEKPIFNTSSEQSGLVHVTRTKCHYHEQSCAKPEKLLFYIYDILKILIALQIISHVVYFPSNRD